MEGSASPSPAPAPVVSLGADGPDGYTVYAEPAPRVEQFDQRVQELERQTEQMRRQLAAIELQMKGGQAPAPRLTEAPPDDDEDEEGHDQRLSYMFSSREFVPGCTTSAVPSVQSGPTSLVNAAERGEWIVYQDGRWVMGNLIKAQWAMEGARASFPPSGTWQNIGGDVAQATREGKRV